MPRCLCIICFLLAICTHMAPAWAEVPMRSREWSALSQRPADPDTPVVRMDIHTWYPQNRHSRELHTLYLPSGAPSPGQEHTEGLYRAYAGTHTFAYDAEGRCIASTVTPATSAYAGSPSSTRIVYGAHGLIASEHFTSPFTAHTKDYHYDAHGTLLRTVRTNDPRSLTGKESANTGPATVIRYTDHTFDASGKLTSRIVRHEDVPLSLQQFAYNAHGKPVRILNLDIRPSRPLMQGDPHVGDLSPVSPPEHKRGDADNETILHYNADGSCRERTIWMGYLPSPEADALFYATYGTVKADTVPVDADARAATQALRSKTVWEYAAHNRVTRILAYAPDGAVIEEQRYLYDERGYWIRHIQSVAPMLVIHDRHITYP